MNVWINANHIEQIIVSDSKTLNVVIEGKTMLKNCTCTCILLISIFNIIRSSCTKDLLFYHFI